MPIATTMASDAHVPMLESINWAQALVVRSRYSIVSIATHNTTTKMLSGKRKMPTGKLPKLISMRKDNKTIAPKIQTFFGGINLLYVVSSFITAIKVALFFEIGLMAICKNIALQTLMHCTP